MIELKKKQFFITRKILKICLEQLLTIYYVVNHLVSLKIQINDVYQRGLASEVFNFLDKNFFRYVCQQIC